MCSLLLTSHFLVLIFTEYIGYVLHNMYNLFLLYVYCRTQTSVKLWSFPRSHCRSACFFQVGVIVVQCLLLIFYTSSVFLFIGTFVLGLCISSVFPSMLAFTEDILDYKGKLTHTFSAPKQYQALCHLQKAFHTVQHVFHELKLILNPYKTKLKEKATEPLIYYCVSGQCHRACIFI